MIFHLCNLKRERESAYASIYMCVCLCVCVCVCVLRGIKSKDAIMFTIFFPLHLDHKE